MRNDLIARACALVVSVLAATNVSAAGLFGVPDYNFEKYCALNAPRNTVVYIDQASIVPDGRAGMPHWVEQLRSKTESSLMPGERLSIVKIASVDGSAQQVWTGCYPGLSPQQAANSASMVDKFFSFDATKELKESRQSFATLWLQEVHKIFEEARGAVASGKSGNIVKALASDEARFESASRRTRCVVFSSLREAGSPVNFNSAQANEVTEYAARLNLDLRRSVFYFYGVDMAGVDAAGGQAMRRNWERFLAKSRSALGGFGQELSMPSSQPVQVMRYVLEVSFPDGRKTGQMDFYVDREGKLVDGVMSIDSLAGSFGALRDGVCRLVDGKATIDAKVQGVISTQDAYEIVALSGAMEKMSGKIHIPGGVLQSGVSASFDLVAHKK